MSREWITDISIINTNEPIFVKLDNKRRAILNFRISLFLIFCRRFQNFDNAFILVINPYHTNVENKVSSK